MKTATLVGVSIILPLFAWLTQTARADIQTKAFDQIIEEAKLATVGVLPHGNHDPREAEKAHFSIRGTGVHIGNGNILTARHAVERQEGGRMVIPKEIAILTVLMEEYTAIHIGSDEFLDLALYRVKNADGPSFRHDIPFSQQDPAPGDEVFTVGYPLGWGPAIAFGRIGNPNTFLPTADTRLLQIDLSACSGNSGGGLFNTRGELVGIIHAIIQTESRQAERYCSRFAFAVPGQLVQKAIDTLLSGQHLEYSKLGIAMTAIKLGSVWHLAVAKATGPARDSGMREGDIILSIDGTLIQTAAALKTYLVEQTKPGQNISVRVRRGDTEETLTITLGRSSARQ